MDGERDLVHVRALDAGDLAGVLLAAALLQARQRAVLAGGVDERDAACVDLRLAAAEVQGGGLLGALRALDVGLHRQQIGTRRLRDAAALAARALDALGGGLQLLLADALVRDAGGKLLGALLLGALAKRLDALETELEGLALTAGVVGGGGWI